jgi:hypothetical protein
MLDKAQKAALEKQAIKAHIQNAEACLNLFADAVYRRHIVHNCFRIRIRIAALIHGIRDLELIYGINRLDTLDLRTLHAVAKDLDALYALCCKLRGLCAYFQDNFGALPGLLLRKPSADLSDLCTDLAQTVSPEVYALAQKNVVPHCLDASLPIQSQREGHQQASRTRHSPR